MVASPPKRAPRRTVGSGAPGLHRTSARGWDSIRSLISEHCGSCRASLLDSTARGGIPMSTVETTTPTMCHHVVRLRSEMTIAELATEWFRLQPSDESDDYGDHSDCRFERIIALEHGLTRRPATCADDVLHTFKV